jgi:hypothetical protein
MVIACRWTGRILISFQASTTWYLGQLVGQQPGEPQGGQHLRRHMGQQPGEPQGGQHLRQHLGQQGGQPEVSEEQQGLRCQAAP